MTTKDQLAIAKLYMEGYMDHQGNRVQSDRVTSDLGKYSTDQSKINTDESAPGEVSSIIYKTDGGASITGVLYLQKIIKSLVGNKRYKGDITKGYGTTELFFYGTTEQAQRIMEQFKSQYPITDKFKYILSQGSQDSKTNPTGRFQDPTTGNTGTLYR